jgi:hypothetical protein
LGNECLADVVSMGEPVTRRADGDTESTFIKNGLEPPPPAFIARLHPY